MSNLCIIIINLSPENSLLLSRGVFTDLISKLLLKWQYSCENDKMLRYFCDGFQELFFSLRSATFKPEVESVTMYSEGVMDNCERRNN